jgi:ribonucleoside-diphosphate reductase beta chain
METSTSLILSSPDIFNPRGNDKERQVWLGNTTNLMNLNSVKFKWALSLYNQMRGNFWIPQKIDVTSDVTDYNNLTPAEQRAYNGTLAYLTFLDSVQTKNLPNISGIITAPEITLCLTEQASQEGMHNQSYQVLIEAIIPAEKRDSIYELWREDPVLQERCQYIANYYQQYQDNPTAENYFISLVADYLLEGMYFYPGFIFFYNLASRQLMAGSADMIRLINRDELSHVRLMGKLVEEGMQVFPFSTEQIYEMVDTAIQKEKRWSEHIIGDDILGISQTSTEQYLKYLGDTRLKAIGLSPLYNGEFRSPYSHLEKFADTKGGANTKANFFESAVTSYMMSESVAGWEDI